MQVAIDGPSGAGKSTIAKQVAKRLEAVYIDTGAMYRVVGLLTERLAIASDKIETAEGRAILLPALKNLNITFGKNQKQSSIFLNDEDVTNLIRSNAISQRASKVSTIRQVRQKLVYLQRQIASSGNVVMDGRDIASVVLPEAEYKFFLTATPEVRAKRRFLQWQSTGQLSMSLEELTEEIRQRDERDMNRTESPLRQVADALVIDSSELTIEQVVQFILDEVKPLKQK